VKGIQKDNKKKKKKKKKRKKIKKEADTVRQNKQNTIKSLVYGVMGK